VDELCQVNSERTIRMISDSAILAAQKIASESAARESLIFAGKEIPAHLRKERVNTMSSNAKVTVSQSSIENVVKETLAAMLPSMMSQMMTAVQQQVAVTPTVAPVVAVKPEETPEGNIALTVNKDVLTIKVNLTKGGNRASQKGNRYVGLANYAHFYIDENGQYVPCASHKAPSDRTEYSLNLTVMEVKR